jgi:hypothetical protein
MNCLDELQSLLHSDTAAYVSTIIISVAIGNHLPKLETNLQAAQLLAQDVPC